MGNTSTGRTLLLVCFSTEGQLDDVHTHLANTVVADSSCSPCRCSSSSGWHRVCWLMHLALFVKANIVCLLFVSCTSLHMLFFFLNKYLKLLYLLLVYMLYYQLVSRVDFYYLCLVSIDGSEMSRGWPTSQEQLWLTRNRKGKNDRIQTTLSEGKYTPILNTHVHQYTPMSLDVRKESTKWAKHDLSQSQPLKVIWP